MIKYQQFTGIMEAIEEADLWEGRIVAVFMGDDEQIERPLGIDDLQQVAAQYRALEKERDELQERFDNLRRRIEDTLEES